MKVLNAFSLNMIDDRVLNAGPFSCSVRAVSLDEAKVYLGGGEVESCVGHADTAEVFSSQLGVPVPFNRTNVSLKYGDVALVGQYRGPRLPEGCKTLPEGATIVWLMVRVQAA